MNPRITIVTIVRNDAEGFRRTAQSVASQDYPDLEFVVVDGGSVDGTLSEIDRFAGRIHTWISGPDEGIYDAMNKGTGLARGEWILFLNAGDVLAAPDVLSRVFQADPAGAGVLYGDSVAAYPRYRVYRKASSAEEVWKGMPFCHQSMITRADLLREHPFDPLFRVAGDHDLVYRLYRNGAGFLYLPLAICMFDVSGRSNRHYLRSWRERTHIYRKYGRVTPAGILYYWLLFAIFAGTAAAYHLFPASWITRMIRWRNRNGIMTGRDMHLPEQELG